MCVCEITQVLKVSQSTVSGHLRVLREAEIVEDTKDGLWVEYSLGKNEALIKDILKSIETFNEHDPEMHRERQQALHADRNILCKK